MQKKGRTRWLAALLALLMTLALAGCSGSSGTESVRLMVWSPSED